MDISRKTLKIFPSTENMHISKLYLHSGNIFETLRINSAKKNSECRPGKLKLNPLILKYLGFLVIDAYTVKIYWKRVFCRLESLQTRKFSNDRHSRKYTYKIDANNLKLKLGGLVRIVLVACSLKNKSRFLNLHKNFTDFKKRFALLSVF